MRNYLVEGIGEARYEESELGRRITGEHLRFVGNVLLRERISVNVHAAVLGFTLTACSPR